MEYRFQHEFEFVSQESCGGDFKSNITWSNEISLFHDMHPKTTRNDVFQEWNAEKKEPKKRRKFSNKEGETQTRLWLLFVIFSPASHGYVYVGTTDGDKESRMKMVWNQTELELKVSRMTEENKQNKTRLRK